MTNPRTSDKPLRGEIWLVASDPENPPVGTEMWSDRPAVVLSNDVTNKRGGFSTIAYMSTSTRKLSGPHHVPVPPVHGSGRAVVLCEQLHTVDHSRMKRKLGQLEVQNMRDIESAIELALNMGRSSGAALFRKWENHLSKNSIDIAQEIKALAGKTTDDRVQALEHALALMTRQRDAYRAIVETSVPLADVMEELPDRTAMLLVSDEMLQVQGKNQQDAA